MYTYIAGVPATDTSLCCFSAYIHNQHNITFSFLLFSFENIEEKSNKISRAYQVLTQTDDTRDAFQTNVTIAYEITSKVCLFVNEYVLYLFLFRMCQF